MWVGKYSNLAHFIFDCMAFYQKNQQRQWEARRQRVLIKLFSLPNINEHQTLNS